jgi:hypothetical protein
MTPRPATGAVALCACIALGGCSIGRIYTVRLGGGVTTTSDGEVGGQIVLGAGFNGHVAGNHHMAGAVGLGVARRGETGVCGSVSAEWLVALARALVRAGPTYTVLQDFDREPVHQAIGLRAAALYSLRAASTSVPSGDPVGRTFNIADDEPVDQRISAGLEAEASIIIDGATDAGRGLGYVGAVLQLDVLARD